MQFSDAEIREFQLLWKKETGKDISAEEARGHAENVVGLVALVYKSSPISHESNQT
jgi:hypothetical protein